MRLICLRRPAWTACPSTSRPDTRRLLEDKAAGVGYLLKDRVANVAEFADALARVAAGGTALDPEVVSQLVRVTRQAQVVLDNRRVLAVLHYLGS